MKNHMIYRFIGFLLILYSRPKVMFLAVKMMMMVPHLGCDPFLSTKCSEKSLLLYDFHILPTHPVSQFGARGIYLTPRLQGFA